MHLLSRPIPQLEFASICLFTNSNSKSNGNGNSNSNSNSNKEGVIEIASVTSPLSTICPIVASKALYDLHRHYFDKVDDNETAIEIEAETETAIETEAVEESAVAIESAATGAPEQTQTRKRTRNATINTGASDKSTLPLRRSERIKQKRMLKDSSNVEKEATLHILIIIGHQGEAQQEFEVHRCALLINTMCTTPSRCASVEVDMHH
jgi:hypothetical protein